MDGYPRSAGEEKGQRTKDNGQREMKIKDKEKIKGEEYDHEDEQCLGAISQHYRK